MEIFDKEIINVLGCIPSVKGSYELVGSKTLEIHPLDVANFEALFKKVLNNNYGNGELALYWLLKDKGIQFDKTNKNDLIYNDTRVEVKKYLKQKLIKIGKISRDLMPELLRIQKIIGDTLLLSYLNKTAINQFLKDENNAEFRELCHKVACETLAKKVGENGIIINFKSSREANIYTIDTTQISIDIVNCISFNEGYLSVELDNL